MKSLIYCVILSFGAAAFAQTEHTVVRRVSVFPIKVKSELRSVAEEAWWELRDLFTRDKRFLVASKNFLIQKDVLQSRSSLSPADAIILGKLLDAHALVTTFVEDRTLHMHVYEGDYGRLLWKHELVLQPSLPIAEQLLPAALKLAQDFIASIPYQGYVIVDPLKGEAVFKEGRRMMFRAEVGISAEIEVGDQVQLVRVFSQNLDPLFTDGGSVEVFAEGRIVEVDRQTVTVELDRVNKDTPVYEGALVRLPKELKRLKQAFALSDKLRSKIDPEFLSPGMTSAKQKESEYKPLIASLTFIANIAVFLLLAF